MPKWNTDQIRKRARELVLSSPEGIRYGRIIHTIHSETPETSETTIAGSVWNIHILWPNEISKPARGLYMPTNGRTPLLPPEPATKASVREEDFYQSFADLLRGDLDEATEVGVLGGNAMRGKWGTPDVVGVYKPRLDALIKFEREIVAAEIKVSPWEAITAFGQAVAYRLFATRSYLVLPSTLSPEETGRVDSLAMLYGIGLVLFDLNPAEPNWDVKVRAQRFTPDFYYVNEFADRLKAHDPTTFERLFR